jgi:DNA-binding GntR family transcriptional regulator
MAAGRLSWRAAHNNARRALEALESGDRDVAQAYAWEAIDHYVAAIEARVRSQDMKFLHRPSQRRGRPRKKIEE